MTFAYHFVIVILFNFQTLPTSYHIHLAMIFGRWGEIPSHITGGSLWLCLLVLLVLFIWIVDSFHVTSSRFLAKRRPEVVHGLAQSWPCCSWTPGSFATKYGDLMVNVSHGIEEMTGRTVKSQMRMRDFVHLLHAVVTERGKKSAVFAATPYLKQLDLDVEMPSEGVAHTKQMAMIEEGLRWLGTSVQTNFWMGSFGCITGLHSDDEDNFLVQCHGTKRVCLIPPGCHGNLYVNTKYDAHALPNTFASLRHVKTFRHQTPFPRHVT